MRGCRQHHPCGPVWLGLAHLHRSTVNAGPQALRRVSTRAVVGSLRQLRSFVQALAALRRNLVPVQCLRFRALEARLHLEKLVDYLPTYLYSP